MRRYLVRLKRVGEAQLISGSTLKGRFVYIRYFPVRGINGEYLGSIEVTQDITDIKELEGERRLLDEEDRSK
ncbi:MAG: hypothetical protein ACP5QI_05495 [Candidatus Bathyarchaeia archaeon]